MRAASPGNGLPPLKMAPPTRVGAQCRSPLFPTRTTWVTIGQAKNDRRDLVFYSSLDAAWPGSVFSDLWTPLDAIPASVFATYESRALSAAP